VILWSKVIGIYLLAAILKIVIKYRIKGTCMAHQTTMTAQPKQRTIIVEGNIGSGKSTFLKIIKEQLNLHVVYEPLHKWKNVGGGGENILEKFYVDTKRWAYTFQTYAFVTRVLEQEEHARKYPSPLHIVERSVFSDRYCFAKNGFELGVMSLLEWQLYQEWFSWLVTQYVPRPDGFIYLRTEPTTCYERIAKRARYEEVSVTLDYLQQLHEKHEDWLIAKNSIDPILQDVPVLVLPCDEEFELDLEQQQKHVATIVAFLEKTADFHYNSSQSFTDPLVKRPIS
jgi:deoxyadenosine/deoxycytidine kinase